MKNIFYAQSGGATAVINATACGVIKTAREYPEQFGKVLAGKNGIIGALSEDLIDTSQEPLQNIEALYYTPACAFGSCRYKLAGLEEDHKEYKRLIDVFAAHDIAYFFYNGGNDSQDTTYKISQMSKTMGYPLQCIGLPKTIDNDLAYTDNCPGFGSVAKYVATSTREAGFDVSSMALTSTKVFILEVMGRHAGWIAAASGLASETPGQAPHVILLPEVPFDAIKFVAKVEETVQQQGFCVIVASEGVRDEKGIFLSNANTTDAFGHAQLGGVAPVLAQLIKKELGYKYHWAVADYLQRAARHIASRTDLEQAYALGRSAIEAAIAGEHGIMMTIKRLSNTPYEWEIGKVPLQNVANQERQLPADYISKDGMHITESCKTYLAPLIQGEDYPPFKNGLPHYIQLKNELVPKKLHSKTTLV